MLHLRAESLPRGLRGALLPAYLPDCPCGPRGLYAPRSRAAQLWQYVLLANIGDKVVFATDAIIIGMFLPIAALTPYAIAGTLIESMRSVVKAMAWCSTR